MRLWTGEGTGTRSSCGRRPAQLLLTFVAVPAFRIQAGWGRLRAFIPSVDIGRTTSCATGVSALTRTFFVHADGNP